MRCHVSPVWFAAALAACGSSPPAQFFVLDAIQPARRAAVPMAIPIRIAAVHIPSTLDRQEMVRESASVHLTISDQHRWGAPLGEMTARVLTQDLAQRLPPGMVVFPQEPPPARVNDVVVDILQFGSGPTGTVTFDGSWSLVQSGGDSTTIGQHLHLDHAAPTRNFADQAATMSALLGELADSIATRVTGK